MFELEFAIEVAKEAGKIHMRNLGKVKTEYKGKELVTESDREANRYIVDQLISKYSYGIISEELDEVKSESFYKWYVDPLDNTSSFTYGSPLFNVSIGLAEGNDPIVGVIYNPYTEDLYFADENGSFFKNERLQVLKKNKVRPIKKLDDATILTNGPQHGDAMDYFLAVRDAFSPPYVRRSVTARCGGAEELAYVSTGRSDGCAMAEQKPWDIAAGIAIARRAGARVVDFNGENATPGTKNIIAANPKLAEQMLEQMKGRITKF